MRNANVKAIENIIRSATSEQIAELMGMFVDQMLQDISDANVYLGSIERHIEHAESVNDQHSAEYWRHLWDTTKAEHDAIDYALTMFCRETLHCDQDAIIAW